MTEDISAEDGLDPELLSSRFIVAWVMGRWGWIFKRRLHLINGGNLSSEKLSSSSYKKILGGSKLGRIVHFRAFRVCSEGAALVESALFMSWVAIVLFGRLIRIHKTKGI